MNNEARVLTRTVSMNRWLDELAGGKSTLIPSATSHFTHVAPAWKIAPRVLKDHLLYLVVDGFCRGIVGGREVLVQVGSCLWIPAGIPMEFNATSTPPMRLYHLRFRLTDGAREIVPRGGAWFQRHALSLQTPLEAAIDEIRFPRLRSGQRIRALLVLLFTSLARLREPRARRGTVFNDSQRKRIREHVASHLRERMKPAELARVLRFSHDYFTRVFRRTYGMAPRYWLMRERIRQAATRLGESDFSIKEVAHEFGYEDLFLFSRQFSSVYGRGPRAYREGL